MKIQSLFEERLNALTHAIGAVLGIVALVLLIVYNSNKTDYSLFSVIVYGLSIIILFSASTLYHSVKDEGKKHYFRIVDHVSIYLLIAGTYTPVLLITLSDSLGWTLFYVVWGIAAFGVILKLFFTGKFEVFSTLLYLVMGWLIIFDFSNLSNIIGDGILFLFAGGLAYTVGIVFTPSIVFHIIMLFGIYLF
jgi:hemolysin III